MHEPIHRDAGVYVVTLLNEHLISVNADRPAIAERCIKVNREHCKFGKALNLQTRRSNYLKTFGVEYVRFYPIAAIEQPAVIESLVASYLLPYRMRGLTGRPTTNGSVGFHRYKSNRRSSPLSRRQGSITQF